MKEGFKSGDRVRLEGSELKGIIISVPFPGSFNVRWDTGQTGLCKAEHLEHITQPVRS